MLFTEKIRHFVNRNQYFPIGKMSMSSSRNRAGLFVTAIN